MAEEPKPIKTERIDNPDGTYTVKEFYEKSLTLAVYDNNDKLLSNEWYKDYDCQEFIGKFWREYNKDNSYIEYCIYEKPLINLKSQMSEIKYADKNDKIILYKIFSDKEFTKLIAIAKREYNKDGSCTQYSEYEIPQEKSQYLSSITKLNKNETKMFTTTFKNKNYTEVCFSSNVIFNKSKEQSKEVIIYEKPDLNNSWISAIHYTNIKTKKTKSIYYADRNLRKKVIMQLGKYLPNNNYQLKIRYYNKKEVNSKIMVYNSENKIIEKIFFLDKYWKKEYEKEITEYKENGIVDFWTIWTTDQKSFVQEYLNEEDFINKKKPILEKYFNDINAKELTHTINYHISDNGSYEKEFLYTKECNGCTACNECVRKVELYNREEQCIKKLCYYKNNQLRREVINNSDSSSIEKVLYKKPDKHGFLSKIEYYNSEGESIKGLGFKDSAFKELMQTSIREVTEYGYLYKTIYEQPKDDIVVTISKKDKNYKSISYEEYKDRECKIPYLIVNYKPIGNLIEKRIIYTEPYKNHLSIILLQDDNYNSIKGKYFYDNNYSELDYTSIFRRLKNCYIKLSTFINPSDGYYSLIEKYDNNKNLIYKKQYKFKGILAHILFWLAR